MAWRTFQLFFKSNQLRNVNTVRWGSRNITTQLGEIDDRKSEVIAFVVNVGMDTANKFYIEIKERSFFVWSIFDKIVKSLHIGA